MRVQMKRTRKNSLRMNMVRFFLSAGIFVLCFLITDTQHFRNGADVKASTVDQDDQGISLREVMAENGCYDPADEASASKTGEPGQRAADEVSSAGMLGGDIAPERAILDPYPTFHSVAVDTVNNRVVFSDSNRKGLLDYSLDSGSRARTTTRPLTIIRGPATGMTFIAGVAIDPVRKEQYTVNNDIGDRVMCFSYDDDGNAKPRRVLHVPHQSWGLSLSPKRDELAITVESSNMIVVYPREAKGDVAPLRVIRGGNTGLADPHGIYFDDVNNEMVVANHGNKTTAERGRRSSESSTEKSGEKPEEPAQAASHHRGEGHGSGEHSGSHRSERAATETRAGEQSGERHHGSGAGESQESDEGERAAPMPPAPFEPYVGGHFYEPSITFYNSGAEGDVAPLRKIQGPKTQLNWPMGIDVSLADDVIAVANSGANSILIFKRTAKGDAAPLRVIRGVRTGLNHPMSVAIDRKNKQLWVSNYNDHTGLVFPLSANGDVPPVRVIRNAPAGAPTSGFGNPGAIAYDSRRQEILVPN